MNDNTIEPDLLLMTSALAKIALTCHERDEALSQVTNLGRQVLGSRLCTVIFVDLYNKELKLAACAGCSLNERVDERGIRIGALMTGDDVDFETVAKGDVIERHGLQVDGQGIAKTDVARKYGLSSALCHPLKLGDKLLGYLNHFSSEETTFSERDRRLIQALADQTVAIMIDLENLAGRKRLERLNKITHKMLEIRDVDELLRFVFEESLKLVGATHGLAGRLNLSTGEVDVVVLSDASPQQRHLQPGEGIVGQALQEEKPIRIADIRDAAHRDHYVEFWSDTRSELAVPILVSNTEVHIGREKERRSKPIGVLNFESSRIASFSEEDEDQIWSLAQHAGLMIDKLELDRKVAGLADVQHDLLGKQDWHEILQALGRAITETLGYEYVNISIVKPELNRIATEYIVGIPDRDIEIFRRMSNHSLKSNDIHADIVRSRTIEVPDIEDERFDSKIYKRFDHSKWIRVFVPMISQSYGHVVGTVEAGYDRSFRKYIYEQDIEILRGFVDYVTIALERRERGFLNRISHELRAPIVGIRNNAVYLQHKYQVMKIDTIQRKFDDIRIDCEIALLQVKELEYLLGRVPFDDKIEPTLVFRDIVIKTVSQLKPLAVSRGLDASKMEYDRSGIRKIGALHINRAKLSQVVYNILINSIKYAESDPSVFSIIAYADDVKDFLILGFKDWGIGIRKGQEERVFEQGYRSPEGLERDVTGSGLGLTISRKIMEDMGGYLRLTHTYKPTEFQVWLPKSLEEAPDDSVRG